MQGVIQGLTIGALGAGVENYTQLRDSTVRLLHAVVRYVLVASRCGAHRGWRQRDMTRFLIVLHERDIILLKSGVPN
jgi:hypothetical protein